MFLNRGPSATTNTGTLRGSWHQGLTHLRLDGEGVKDELLLAGRRMIAKDDKTDWVLRVGRFADGNQTGFLPDVQLLLTQLAMWPLAVTQRTVGSLDDRPIEIFSVTLNPDQVADASFTDLIPESLASTANPFAQLLRIQAVGNGKPLRQPLQKPESTIDIAIFVDPATGTVHQLRFRSWTKQDPRFANAGRAAIVVRNGVAQQVGPAEEDEDEDENAKADAPLQYEGGLPERRRKNMTVREYTVKLTGHGQTAAPELSDKQRQLLGLPPR